MKYLFTGGGTGGHVYPALAIADEIRRRQPDAEFLYVGLKNRLESWVVPGRGYPIKYVRSRPFPRSRSLLALTLFSLTLFWGMVKGCAILLRFRPDLIVGTGGYVSAPILFAYGLLSKLGLVRTRVFLYEPNAYPGLLNKRIGRLAHRIGVAFEQAGRWFDMRHVAVVGYPVRRELLEVDRDEARRRLDIPPSKKVVLAFGGSVGARVINRAVVEALPRLRQCPDLLLLHVTGRYAGADYDAVRDTEHELNQQGIQGDTSSWYRRFDYLEDIQYAYGAADLVICRGGAGTLTEVGCCGLPALIVPKAEAAEDHQALNARELERRGAAKVIYQEAAWKDGRVFSRVDGCRLAGEVLGLVADEERRLEMARIAASVPLKDSLDLILCEVDSLASGRRPPRLNLEFPPPVAGVPPDPNRLLRWVRERVQKVGGVRGLEPRELAYLRYQADRLLVSDGWYEIPFGRRNVGVKLVGCLEYREHLPLLLGILADRHRVGWVARWCGGDFRHGGLLRRNVIETGILPLRATDEEVKLRLIQALEADPYFEVRAAAARALGELFIPAADLEKTLIGALEDVDPTVVAQAIRALGTVGQEPEILGCLQKFYLHGNWHFRREVVVTLKKLTERGVLDTDLVVTQLEQILATSPFFQPRFPLNEKLSELAEFLQPQKGT